MEDTWTCFTNYFDLASKITLINNKKGNARLDSRKRVEINNNDIFSLIEDVEWIKWRRDSPSR
jgi:hypothetical protein